MKTKRQIEKKIKELESTFPNNEIVPPVVVGMKESLYWVLEK